MTPYLEGLAIGLVLASSAFVVWLVWRLIAGRPFFPRPDRERLRGSRHRFERPLDFFHDAATPCDVCGQVAAASVHGGAS